MRRIPRQSRSRATVDAIVEAARRLLLAEGYAALNINTVAEVAGVGIGSLYEYFESKAELSVAAADAVFTLLESGLAEIPRDASQNLSSAIANLALDAARACAVALPLRRALREQQGHCPAADPLDRLERGARAGFETLLTTRAGSALPSNETMVPAVCARVLFGLVGGPKASAANGAVDERVVVTATTVICRYLGLQSTAITHNPLNSALRGDDACRFATTA